MNKTIFWAKSRMPHGRCQLAHVTTLFAHVVAQSPSMWNPYIIFHCFPQTFDSNKFFIQSPFDTKQTTLERYGRDLRNGVIIIAIWDKKYLVIFLGYCSHMTSKNIFNHHIMKTCYKYIIWLLNHWNWASNEEVIKETLAGSPRCTTSWQVKSAFQFIYFPWICSI